MGAFEALVEVPQVFPFGTFGAGGEQAGGDAAATGGFGDRQHLDEGTVEEIAGEDGIAEHLAIGLGDEALRGLEPGGDFPGALGVAGGKAVGGGERGEVIGSRRPDVHGASSGWAARMVSAMVRKARASGPAGSVATTGRPASELSRMDITSGTSPRKGRS